MNKPAVLCVKSLTADTIFGVISDYYSLIWTIGFNDIGDFELVLPYTEKYMELLKPDRILVRVGDVKLHNDAAYNKNSMVITHVSISNNENEKRIIVKGREYLYLLQRRALSGKTSYSGMHVDNIQNIVEKCCVMSKTKDERVMFERITMINNVEDESKYTFEKTGGQISDVLINYAKMHGFGIKAFPIYSFDYTAIGIEISDPKEKTPGRMNEYSISFSEETGSISGVEYEYDISEYANFATVAGGGEGSDRVFVDVNLADNSTNPDFLGINRREVYIDARDLQREDTENLVRYQNRLKERGREKLVSEFNIKEGFSCDVNYNKYEYSVDYNVGDIMLIKSNFGTYTILISMVTLSYDENGHRCIPTLTNIWKWGIKNETNTI